MARDYLKTGTWIKLAEGEYYRITGAPLGEGGGSIVYPCEKAAYMDGVFHVSKSRYALKECYPLSGNYVFIRNEQGEIVSQSADPIAEQYLKTVKEMQLSEYAKAEMIYNTSSRMIPVLSGADHIEISVDDGESFTSVNNTVSVMPSLELKGNALRAHLAENTNLSVLKSLQLTKLLLLSVKEIHDAGYLHLDIQDGNIFVRGSMGEENLVSLIDFGSTRQMLADGLCETIWDCVVFSTNGFSAPEIQEGNDGTLRLGKEADIYSIGYTLLLMLTGTKYSQRELDFLSTGHILSGRRIKKIGCPVHMADRLRQILSHALKRDPQERYHSCDEMLAEVTDFLDALTPYKTTLSQVVYDAFICYRHGAIDSPVSKALQQRLEHLRCPKGIAAKKKQIKKVFVDEGELASCADFGLQIREALKNSEWLIVICSPDTKESPWVNLEIRTFLEYHDRSHILALVTEGEPKDVFPEALLGDNLGVNEVLAADARGDNLSQITKKVKKDAALKLAAPIFGVTYDTLKQRHREYRRKQILSIACLVVLFAGSFLAYSAFQKYQIRQITREKLEKQAIMAADSAVDRLNHGDRDGAIKEVLNIRDPENPEHLVSSRQTYVLNSALNSYSTGEWVYFMPSGSVGENVEEGYFSENGQYLFTREQDNIIRCYSEESQEELWKISSDDIRSLIDEEPYRFSKNCDERINTIIPFEEDQLLFLCDHVAGTVSAGTGKIELLFPIEKDTGENYQLYEDTLYVEDNGRIFSYDVKTGKQISKLNVESFFESEPIKKTSILASINIVDFSVNPSGDKIAMVISQEEVSEDEAYGLYLYDSTDDSLKCLSNTAVACFQFLDDNRLATISIELSEKVSLGPHDICVYQLSVYDLLSGNEIASSDPLTVPYANSHVGILYKEFISDENTFNGIVFYLNERVYIMDLDYGALIGQFYYDAPVLGITDWRDNSFIICSESGWTQRISIDNAIRRYDFIKESYTVDAFDILRNDWGIVLTVNGHEIFYKIGTDRKLEYFELFDSLNQNYDTIHFYTDDDYSFFSADNHDYADESTDFMLCDTETKKIVYQFHCQEGKRICNIQVSKENDEIWLTFFEVGSLSGETEPVNFHKINLLSKKEETFSFSHENMREKSLIYNSKRQEIIYRSSEDQLVLVSLLDHQTTEQKKLNYLVDENMFCLTGDGRYLFMVGRISNENTTKKYLIYDFDQEEFYEMESATPEYSSIDHSGLIASKHDSKVCYYQNGKLSIIDCSKHMLLSAIDLHENMATHEFDCAFFNHDQNLLVSETSEISIYNAETGAFENSASYSTLNNFGLYDGGSIETDDSESWFAIVERGGAYNEEHGHLRDGMLIFHMDADMNPAPYAEVADGYADFQSELVMIPNGNKIYYSSFYDDKLLIQEAEELMPLEEEDSFGSSAQELINYDSTQDGVDSSAKSTSESSKNQTKSQKKKSVVSSERNRWEYSENVSPIKADDQGDVFVVSLSDEQTKKLERVTANILLEGSDQSGTHLFAKVLLGRELEINDNRQIVFQKNQEIWGMIDTQEKLNPITELYEEKDRERKVWSTDGFFVNDNIYGYRLDSPCNYLYLTEDQVGNINYSIYPNKEKVLRKEYEAFIANTRFVTVYARASDSDGFQTGSGITIPADKWQNNYWSLDRELVDLEGECPFTYEKLDAFSECFYGQICLYYSDGSIQTTDYLPLKEKTGSSYEKYEMTTEDGTWDFDLYDTFAVLNKYSGKSEVIRIPETVKNIPVTRISTRAFVLDIEDFDKEIIPVIVIPKSIQSIEPNAIIGIGLVNIQLDDVNSSFKIVNGLLMTADGKRVISAADHPGSNLIIPAGVEEIDPCAFMNCERIKSIEFPASLKVIGSYAFYNCDVKELVLPDSLEHIGEKAFYRFSLSLIENPDITKIETIRLGKNVQYIGRNAFDGLCVDAFSVSSENNVYCSEDGVIYSKDKKIMYQYPTGKSGSYTVPEGVEVIFGGTLESSGLYRDCVPESWGLTELVLSDTVRCVEAGNIPQSDNLGKLVCGKNLETLEDISSIDPSIINLIVDGSKIIQDDDGSYYNREMTELLSCSKTASTYVFPETVTSIDYGAFRDCSQLRKIVIPSMCDLDANATSLLVYELNDSFNLKLQELEVEAGNPDFSCSDGKLMSKSGKTVLFDGDFVRDDSETIQWTSSEDGA